MPESLQYSDKGSTLENVIDALDNATQVDIEDNLQEIIDYLQDAIDY